MATLNINGQNVQVDDGFLKLPHDQQQSTVEEIASSLKSAAPPVSAGEDALKSIGSGLGNAAIGTLGMAGDLTDLGSRGIEAATNYIGGKLGVEPYHRPEKSVLDYIPTSESLRKTVTDPIVSPDYKPQTTAGGYLKTGAEFLPAMIGGPESAISKLLTRVAVPAVASETAGKLTEGTAAEPYARIAAAGLGGFAAAKSAEARAASQALRSASPEASALKTEAGNAYDALTARNVAIPLPQSALDALANNIRSDLNNRGLRPSVAGNAHNAVEELRTPATAGAPDVADLVAARQSVKNLLGSPDANKAAAATIIPKIEQAIETASPNTMNEIRMADKNYAAFKANEALDKRFARAELRAAGEHSGLNLGNRIRQQVTNYLLSNEAKYLSPENRTALEKVVKGTVTQNGLRLVSNMMGGGGGLGSTLLGIGGAATGQATGHPELSLLPVGGFGVRALANRSVAKQAERAAAMIRANSPLGRTMAASLPAPQRMSLPRSLLPALLATASQRVLGANN